MGQAKSRGSREQRIAQALVQAEQQSRVEEFSIYPRAALLDKSYVLGLCAEVDSESAPVRVPCRPMFGGQLNDCFPLVERKVKESGGKFVLGWAIWERPGILVEAELHAVWQSPEGGLIDISPRDRQFSSITFLPDSKGLSYTRQVDNVRRPLSSDPRTVRFIELFSEQFAILNEGDLADKFGPVTLPPERMRRYESIERELMSIEEYFLRQSLSRK